MVGKIEGRRRRGSQRMRWLDGITNCGNLLMSTKSVMPSSHLILCHPLLLPPLIFPSIKVFSNQSVLHIRWPKDWSFSFSISPPNEYSPLISFRTDWFDLLSVQGTPNIDSLVLSFLYGPTVTSIHDYWKNHSLDYTDLVGKVMSLLFNMLSRLVIAFLPRSKCLLISWLQSPSAVILEPKNIKSIIVFIVSTIYSFLFYCFPLFLCIVYVRRLSYLCLLFFGILHSVEYIFCFLLCFPFLFSAICKASSDNHFAFLHFFFFVMVLASYINTYCISISSVVCWIWGCGTADMGGWL